IYLESDQPICAWASQIENLTDDPVFLWGRSSGSDKILIPSAANLASFASTLSVVNTGSNMAQVSIKAYNVDGAVTGQTHVPIALSPKATLKLENVLEALGVEDNFGPLEIDSLNGVPLLATSRVSNMAHFGGVFDGFAQGEAS